jgi:hypothetical protein
MHFVEHRQLIGCLTSKSEIYIRLKKSEQVKRAFFRVLTEEEELKIEESGLQSLLQYTAAL